jgi:hypothetical protein
MAPACATTAQTYHSGDHKKYGKIKRPYPQASTQVERLKMNRLGLEILQPKQLCNEVRAQQKEQAHAKISGLPDILQPLPRATGVGMFTIIERKSVAKKYAHKREEPQYVEFSTIEPCDFVVWPGSGLHIYFYCWRGQRYFGCSHGPSLRQKRRFVLCLNSFIDMAHFQGAAACR